MSKFGRALVTGGAGLIGSHIVDELVRRGVETLVVDDFSTGSPTNLRQHAGNKMVKVYAGDVRRVAELLRAAEGVEVVFHEAAIASVPISVEQPMRVHDNNVNATLELMNFCLGAKVRRLVFASSAAVYGILDGKTASEEAQCRPSSPDGASKLSVEDYLSAYHETYGLETVALRYFNVYGPRQRFNNGYSGVITTFANQLLRESRPTIFGDGMQTRDFVNVILCAIRCRFWNAAMRNDQSPSATPSWRSKPNVRNTASRAAPRFWNDGLQAVVSAVFSSPTRHTSRPNPSNADTAFSRAS